MKNCLIKSLVIFLYGSTLMIRAAFAVSEAGEIQRKDTTPPHAEVELSRNLTDLEITPQPGAESVDAIDFSTDEIINDEKNGIITAIGNVEINYNNMRLVTDTLIYDQNKDIITAAGNVQVHTADGSIIYGDRILLSERMTVGEMHNIKARLKDESHIFASSFRRKNNQTKSMHNATYTPCDMCDAQKPLWSISARKIQHDEKSKDLHYNDAVIRIKDVPIFYAPFFSHPDPTVKRRSGLLAPTAGSSNYLGAIIQPRYFWAVDEQTNVLFSPTFSSDKGIIWGGEYKRYFYNGNTNLSGTYLKDDNKDRPRDRGNLFINGRYDINDYWRLTYNLKYVTDYIYLKELSLPYSDDAWLHSNISLERFNGRNYASVQAYYYKLLSYNLHRDDKNQFKAINQRKPFVAPLINIETYSDPSSIGSYFHNEFGTASVYHQNGTQTQRLTAINAWELPYTSPFGEKYRFVASLKSDAYYINKYFYNATNDYTGTTTRFFPQAGIEWRLPFVRANTSSRQIIEPVVVGVLAPNGNNKSDKIPNDDSEDVYFDDTNVLDLNRYAGYDRNDTGSRISYGLRWSSYGDRFGRTSAFIAQTYEFSKNSSFIDSLDSKENSRFSDLVGRINAEPNQYLDLNYRFRLDKKTLDAKYSELGAGFGPTFLRAYVSYIFLQGNSHYKQLYSERKELYTSVSSAFSQFWSVSVYNLQDLSGQGSGSLEHGGNLIYEDECFKWITTVKKYNSSNPDLENNYEFNMTFYLKTVGAFGS